MQPDPTTAPQRVPTLLPPLQDVTTLARKYAKAMHAPLIFCSASHGINVLKLFKLVFEKAFSIESDIEKKVAVGDPIFEY